MLFQGDWRDFYKDPNAFWRQPWFNPVISVVGAFVGIMGLVLAIMLLRKYRARRSRSLLYLGLAFLVFTLGILFALPTQLVDDPILDKIFYDGAKMISVVAVLFYFKFAIAMFYVSGSHPRLVNIFQLIFLIVNLVLIVLDLVVSINFRLVNPGPGSEAPTNVFILILDLFVTVPFVYMAIMALSLSRKAEVEVEKVRLDFISVSAMFKFGTFLGIFINDLITFRNPWSIMVWTCALVAFLCFYTGLTIDVGPGERVGRALWGKIKRLFKAA